MKRERSILLVSVSFTVIFLLLGFFKHFVPSHRLLFACFFLYIVMLPGYLAMLRLAPLTGRAFRVLASFIAGTVLLYLMLFITAFFHLDIRLIGVVTPAVVIALALWVSRQRRASSARPPGDYVEIGREIGSPETMLIILMVAVSLMVLLAGDPFIYTADSADHIAYIRTVSRTHEAFPEQFYYRDGGILTHDIRKGMGQALWGTLNALTGHIDVATVWPMMSLISSIFVLLALFCAGLTLFRNPSIGLVASILFVLFYGRGLRGYVLATNAAGYAMGKIFYVTAFASLPLAIRRPKSGYLLLATASAFAATCTHIAHFAVIVFITGVFILAHLVMKHGKERVILFRNGLFVLATIILTNVPYLTMRYIRDYAPGNPIHMHVQGALYLTDTLYVLNPLVYVAQVGPLGILSIVALLVLLRKSREDEHLRMLLCGLIAVYVFLFNPIWFPSLLRRLTYLVIRFEFAVPSMIVCAYLLRELWQKVLRRNPGMSPFGAVLAFTAAVALLGIPLAKTPSEFAYRPRAMHELTDRSYRNLADLFAFIERECPPGSVIASDPITSFGIPAFTDAYVVCPYDQHSTPNDSTAVSRIVDCRKIFAPGTPFSEIRAIMNEYGAQYLVVNGRLPPSVETMYWKTDASVARSLSERLHEPTSPFSVEYEHRGVTLAKLTVCPTCKEVERSPGRPACFGDSLDVETANRSLASGISGIRIRQVRPSRMEVTRGDTIAMGITWIAEEKCPFASYVAYLRFDTDFPKNVLYREYLSKPYRKIFENVTGRRFRFRIDFQPLGGIMPPDTWPPMHEVHDHLSLVVPRDIAAGTYMISLRLSLKPQFPNYVLKDILTDGDSYSGAVVGSITIR